MKEQGEEEQKERGRGRERETLGIYDGRMYQRIIGPTVSKRPPLQRAIYSRLQRRKSD